MVVQQVAEIFQDFRFVSKKGSDSKVTDIAFEGKIAYRNTDDFSEFGPNSGAFVKGFGSKIVLALVFCFLVEKRLFGFV